MKTIVSVELENEMDLILAHKRAMKLCELTGCSLIVQTSIATAVSEVARCAIEYAQSAVLHLGIETKGQRKFLKAVIRDNFDFTNRASEACNYAKRLVDEVEIVKNPKDYQIALRQQLHFAGTLTETKIESFYEYFKNEPPLSAYDELRRKNLMLHDLAEKLKDSENQYRVLTDSLPLMMFAMNPQCQIVYTNKWLKDFLGITPRDLTSTSWQNALHPSDVSSFNRDAANASIRQQPMSGEYRFKEKSRGTYSWHMFQAMPLKNEKEVVTQWIGFLVDIDAQKQVDQTLRDNHQLKQIQQQLYHNQEELQTKILELNRSNYELEQFAHLASHDLQEPLRKLFFYADVLRSRYSDKVDEYGVNMLNNMTRAAGRMKELINDLLSYSQLQKQDLVFEQVDLNEILQEAIKELEITIQDKGAKIEVDRLPQIHGNALRLRQLFVNLISNSLKYSKPSVAPEIEIKLLTRSDGMHVISVKDNGVGFEPQYSEKIFGLFERLHTRDQYPGTGIGLSICKRIMELHKGRISASSVPGEFALFSIELPAVSVGEAVLQ